MKMVVPDEYHFIPNYFFLYQLADAAGTASLGFSNVEEEINVLEKLDQPLKVLLVFSTIENAERYKGFKFDSSWLIQSMSDIEFAKFLPEVKQNGYTHVSLDPGAVLLGTLPIELFLSAMSLRSMKRQ